MGDPVSIGLMAAETMMSASGDRAAGEASRVSAYHDAEQMDRNAKAVIARGTRDAYEERQAGDILTSNARAQMAAGGGSASDEGAVELLADIKTKTGYNSLAALFDSESEAQGIEYGAEVRRYEGDLANQRAKQKSLTTILSGASKMFKSGGFKSPTKTYANTEINMLKRAGKVR